MDMDNEHEPQAGNTEAPEKLLEPTPAEQAAKLFAPTPAQKPSPPSGLSANEVPLRVHFAGIALGEIVRWQVAEGKGGQEDVAASWALRYADRMISQLRHPWRQVAVQMNRGVPGLAAAEPMVEIQ